MSIKGKTNAQIHIDEPEKLKIGIVQSQWNHRITDEMASECKAALMDLSVPEEHIFHELVPGSFELPLGALHLENTIQPDAVICLGCVIKGETDHDVFINQGVTSAIMNLNLRYGKPFVFGVLTVNNEEQAIARSDGSKENKGKESAEVALEMIALEKRLKKKTKQTIGFRSSSK
ncbi:6,7-dimethyl-8-ribityllumazine synthase [Membranicola marinus]|uniref:6,7-dimethyl-8-ribityllumazine synthase n=1 Tax=Membranihabitans marinus TaxID=1227546 RepID=A0A953L8B0_9BACT|nr:6,7-dimethyl-8-ribityllumazine synthase [Membranihabitans marinus]MBY5957495.1 6,7-dimethyl-8-ribityllumazine synthase [Membranihabitans marinus]